MPKVVVPKYPELSVKQIWSLIKDAPEISKYFPDYDDGCYPEREFLFGVLSSVASEGLKQLISESRQRRSLSDNEEEKNLIELGPGVRETLMTIPPKKCRHFD